MVQSIVTRDVMGEDNSRELHMFLRQILESKQNKRKQEEKSAFLSLLFVTLDNRLSCSLCGNILAASINFHAVEDCGSTHVLSALI